MNINFVNKRKLIFINFKLTKYEQMNIIKITEFYENKRAACIEALKVVQKKRNWISNEAILVIAKFLEITPVDLEGVATFYNRIFRQPVGKNIIYYCNSLVCFINGYKNIKNVIQKELKILSKKINILDKFTLLPICCLGYCDKGPVIMINDKIYTKLHNLSISSILELYK